MSIVQAVRACAVAFCLAAQSAMAVALAAPAHAYETRIGVDFVEFNWDEAAGDPSHYAVWLSRNGSSFDFHELVEENRVAIDVDTGDSLAIYVRGLRLRTDGSWQFGPASEVSSTVQVLGTPRFPDAELGSWILHCPSCDSTLQRDLADVRIATEHLSLPAPWEMAAQAELADGSRWLVWQHPSQRLLALTSLDDPQAMPIAPVAMPPGDFADTIDIAGGGADEFLFVDRAAGNRLDRYALAANGTLVPTGSLQGVVGAELGPVADYTGDGRDDLLLHHLGTRQVAVWSFGSSLQQLGSWQIRDGYVLDLSLPTDIHAAAAADYDADGRTDLLLRRESSGELWIAYLDDRLVEIRAVPWLTGDERLEVVGSPEVDSQAGAEIALRDVESGRLWILSPSHSVRVPVIDTGSDTGIFYVRP